MRPANLLLASVGLLLLGAGCRSAPPPAADADAARIRELEARVARLETQSTAAGLDDQILALEVERAGLLVTYTAEHPAISRIERKIEALRASRAEEARSSRARMLRHLEAQRAQVLVTYTSDHESVRRLDAQIALLRSDEG